MNRTFETVKAFSSGPMGKCIQEVGRVDESMAMANYLTHQVLGTKATGRMTKESFKQIAVKCNYGLLVQKRYN
jgi:hypothetical protein